MASNRKNGLEFKEYARHCVRLAQQPNTPPELREHLLNMARWWLQALMDEEDKTGSPPLSPFGSPHIRP